MSHTKAPPHSRESEMMVLGSAITSSHSSKALCESLQIEDFYFNEHQLIFCALKKLYQKECPIDVHLLCEELKKQKCLAQIGGVAYVVALAQFSGTSTYIEEYLEEVKRLSILRKIAVRSRRAENNALDGKENPEIILEDLKEDLKQLENSYGRKFPICSVKERIEKEDAFLQENKGKKYLGLRTQFIEEFNTHLLGLRGLNLLAAAPNTGKTALSIQLAIDALIIEADTCLVYVSLEMSAQEIFRRMILSLAAIDYRTFVFGAWNEADKEKIADARKTLLSLGERMQILDLAANLDAKAIIDYVETLKTKNGSKRAIVIIDYLQVWPITSKIICFNENEMDKWRIGEMKKLKDALSPDPIIVISEARKPSMKENTWGGDLSDVMGAARATYTPDVVMLLVQLKPKNLKALWEENKMPFLNENESDEGESEKEGLRIKRFLEDQGISICRLEVPKARDGMKKFSVLLEFHFQKNKFRKLNLDELRKNAEFAISRDGWPSKILQKKNTNKSFAQMFIES